jgi:GH18 family chitinase
MNPIAFTTVATNANVVGALMAARALAAGVGRAFLMGYDYRVATSTTVGSVAPLIRAGGGLSLSASLDLYAALGVPIDRVILGLPLYGRTWQTVDQSLGANRVDGTSGTVFFFRDLASLGAEGTILAADTDTLESSVRLVRAVDGAIYQTYYDSPATFAPKLALVDGRGLAGVGFWALGYQPDPAWWALVGTAFGAPPTNADTAPASVADPSGAASQPR